VREIPALAYSWFDADSMRFETTHSQPIALSVGAAQIIGADAVTAREDESESGAAAPGENEPGKNETGERSTSMALTGANLAVERDVATLLRDERGSGHGRPATLALYGAGLACLLFAVFDQRRRAIDPRTTQRREAFRRAERNVKAALDGSGSEAAAALGRALRELVAALPEEADAEFDALISECDALRFAPGAASGAGGGESGAAVPTALADRARRFVADRARDSAKTARDS
jgi:hypothetical protein